MKNWIKKQFTWPESFWFWFITIAFTVTWFSSGLVDIYRAFVTDEVAWAKAGIWQIMFSLIYITAMHASRMRSALVKDLFKLADEQHNAMHTLVEVAREAQKIARDSQALTKETLDKNQGLQKESI